MKTCLDDNIRNIITYTIGASARYFVYRQKFRKTIDTSSLKKSKKYAFVIGNGPSSSEIDWGSKHVKLLLEQSDVITTNSFFLNEFSDEIWPYIHVMSDPDWLISSPEDIISRLGTAFYKSVLENEAKLAQKSPKLLIPAQYSYSNKLEDLTKIYFNDFEHHYFGSVGSLERPRVFSSMTGIKALNTALALNYDRIIFCGLDASQFLGLSVAEKGGLEETYLHAYSDKLKCQTRRTIYNYSMKRRIYDYYKQFRDFELLSEFALKRGIGVVNVGPSSFVDSFERKTIDQVF